MKKNFIVDTCVLIDNPNCLNILRNGDENEIYIPYTVLLELDGLKNDKRISHIVYQIIDEISTCKFIKYLNTINKRSNSDLQIIEDVLACKDKINDPIIVTNDKLFGLLCDFHNVKYETFTNSIPFKSYSEAYTGLLEEKDDPIPNSFKWKNGEIIFYNKDLKESKPDLDKNIWKLRPRDLHQKLALNLLTNENLDIISMQSKSGFGKTFLSLASALYLTFQKKESKYNKIYLVKPTIEIGEKLGYLPGNIDDKLNPHIKYIHSLIYKLYNMRNVKNNKIIMEGSTPQNPKVNTEYIEVLPIQYVRGMNIENSIVVLDECQNFSRLEMRSILTRMCENVKVYLLGDVHQIDNRYLSLNNNGLNWVCKTLIGQPNYSHIVLNGRKSRGPITDTILRSGL